MSKRKRIYVEENYYPNQDKIQYNNLLSNYNNIVDLLNNIDINNLRNIVSMIFNGNDINNFNFNNLNKEINYMDGIYNRNETIINFFNCLKGILKDEFSEIVEKFIKFYMDEINNEKL